MRLQPLIATMGMVRSAISWSLKSGFTRSQTALANFTLNGHFARHLRRMHQTCSARRDWLLAYLRGPLAPWFSPVTPNTASLYLAARLVAPGDEAALTRRASGAGRAAPLASFHVKALPQRGFLSGYGAVEVEQIDVAMTSLASLWRARTLPDAEKRLTYGVFMFDPRRRARSGQGYPGSSEACLPL